MRVVVAIIIVIFRKWNRALNLNSFFFSAYFPYIDNDLSENTTRCIVVNGASAGLCPVRCDGIGKWNGTNATDGLVIMGEISLQHRLCRWSGELYKVIFKKISFYLKKNWDCQNNDYKSCFLALNSTIKGYTRFVSLS